MQKTSISIAELNTIPFMYTLMKLLSFNSHLNFINNDWGHHICNQFSALVFHSINNVSGYANSVGYVLWSLQYILVHFDDVIKKRKIHEINYSRIMFIFWKIIYWQYFEILVVHNPVELNWSLFSNIFGKAKLIWNLFFVLIKLKECSIRLIILHIKTHGLQLF